MPFPLIKEVSVGGQTVKVTCNKHVTPDHRTYISGVGEFGDTKYEERMTLPHDNPSYSQEQAQKDFDEFVNKVAHGTIGRG